MEDLEGCVIDDEFRTQLENASSQTPLTIIAIIRETQGYREAINEFKKSYRASTPEVQQAILDAETEMMQPVCNYLNGLGVKYRCMKSIHAISAQLTPLQALDFIKQPYVQIVCPDQKLFVAR